MCESLKRRLKHSASVPLLQDKTIELKLFFVDTVDDGSSSMEREAYLHHRLAWVVWEINKRAPFRVRFRFVTPGKEILLIIFELKTYILARRICVKIVHLMIKAWHFAK